MFAVGRIVEFDSFYYGGEGIVTKDQTVKGQGKLFSSLCGTLIDSLCGMIASTTAGDRGEEEIR